MLLGPISIGEWQDVYGVLERHPKSDRIKKTAKDVLKDKAIAAFTVSSTQLVIALAPLSKRISAFRHQPSIGRSDLDSGGRSAQRNTITEACTDSTADHLVPLAATAEVTHGSSKDYTLPWLWSRAIYEHDPAIDGIECKSRRDDSLTCVALFDRASNGLQVAAPTVSWSSDVRVLGSILDRYNVALTVTGTSRSMDSQIVFATHLRYFDAAQHNGARTCLHGPVAMLLKSS